MLKSETKKTGKGGRPSRLYVLSEDVIQLQFPFRDYQLLAKIAFNSLLSLGAAGEKRYTKQETIRSRINATTYAALKCERRCFNSGAKVQIAKEAFSTAGLSPAFELSADGTKFSMMYTIVHLKKLLSITQLKFVICTEI